MPNKKAVPVSGFLQLRESVPLAIYRRHGLRALLHKNLGTEYRRHHRHGGWHYRAASAGPVGALSPWYCPSESWVNEPSVVRALQDPGLRTGGHGNVVFLGLLSRVSQVPGLAPGCAAPTAGSAGYCGSRRNFNIDPVNSVIGRGLLLP